MDSDMTNEEMVKTLLNKMENLEDEVKALRSEQKTLVYDTKGLAKALGMSLNYAGKLMATKGFPSTKIGGSWKVSKKALDEWLEHNQWHEIELDR